MFCLRAHRSQQVEYNSKKTTQTSELRQPGLKAGARLNMIELRFYHCFIDTVQKNIGKIIREIIGKIIGKLLGKLLGKFIITFLGNYWENYWENL